MAEKDPSVCISEIPLFSKLTASERALCLEKMHKRQYQYKTKRDTSISLLFILSRLCACEIYISV
jgi:hypothetical protein